MKSRFKSVSLASLSFACYILSIVVYSFGEEFRYATYAIVFPAILASILYAFAKNKKIPSPYSYLIALIIFGFIVNTLVMHTVFHNPVRIRELIFITLGIAGPIFIFQSSQVKTNVLDKLIKLFLILLSIVFSLRFGAQIAHSLRPSAILDLIINSKSETESGLAFIFGLLFLYFLFRKNRTYWIFSLVLVILSSKRIVFLGISTVGLLYTLSDIWWPTIRKSPRIVSILAVAVNCLVIILLYELCLGSFDKLISTTFGMSSNYLFMGRMSIYREVFLSLDGIPFIGKGIGFTSMYLQADESIKLSLLHSDLIKLFIEIGLLLFAIFFYLFYKSSFPSLESFLFIVYYNILAITDNITIYFEVLFLLMFFWVLFKNNNQYSRPGNPELVNQSNFN